MHAECSVTRTVNIVITILAENDEERQMILDALNDADLVNVINAQLPGEANDIGFASPPLVVSTGNLIL